MRLRFKCQIVVKYPEGATNDYIKRNQDKITKILNENGIYNGTLNNQGLIGNDDSWTLSHENIIKIREALNADNETKGCSLFTRWNALFAVSSDLKKFNNKTIVLCTDFANSINETGYKSFCSIINPKNIKLSQYEYTNRDDIPIDKDGVEYRTKMRFSSTSYIVTFDVHKCKNNVAAYGVRFFGLKDIEKYGMDKNFKSSTKINDYAYIFHIKYNPETNKPVGRINIIEPAIKKFNLNISLPYIASFVNGVNAAASKAIEDAPYHNTDVLKASTFDFNLFTFSIDSPNMLSTYLYGVNKYTEEIDSTSIVNIEEKYLNEKIYKLNNIKEEYPNCEIAIMNERKKPQKSFDNHSAVDTVTYKISDLGKNVSLIPNWAPVSDYIPITIPVDGKFLNAYAIAVNIFIQQSIMYGHEGDKSNKNEKAYKDIADSVIDLMWRIVKSNDHSIKIEPIDNAKLQYIQKGFKKVPNKYPEKAEPENKTAPESTSQKESNQHDPKLFEVPHTDHQPPFGTANDSISIEEFQNMISQTEDDTPIFVGEPLNAESLDPIELPPFDENNNTIQM